MSASWAAVLVALGMLAGTLAALLWRGGRRDGRVDAVLERLAEIADDHEDRIRGLEHRPARHRR